MPNAIIRSFSDKSGKDEQEVERLWTKATELVNQKYPEIKSGEDKYYALITGILKKMLKINEDFSVGVAASGADGGTPSSGEGMGMFAPKMGKPVKRKKPSLLAVEYLKRKLKEQQND